MKNIKLFLLTLLIVGWGILSAGQKINFYLSSQRYLDKEQKTVIHIDYQIPYNNLVFLAQKGGYFAEVDVIIDVIKSDSLLFQQTIRDNIGISNKEDARSDKPYLNRISFSLDKDQYTFKVKVKDINSPREGEREIKAYALDPATLSSDLELCSSVRPDSSSFLGKFHRGKTLFQTQPSLIFDKSVSTDLILYFEVYTPEELREESGIIALSVQKDSVMVSDDFIDFRTHSDVEGITLRVPLAQLAPGKYNGSMELQFADRTEEKDFIFFVSEPQQEVYFLSPLADEDFQLLRYFLGNSVPGDWKTMDDITKKRYISQMWKSVAAANNLSPQATLDMVGERVNFANKYFTHFEKGWTSDMGRIHIRKGKPDEIEKDTSSDDTRYVRKDYQIWKYHGNNNAVYLFVDIQMNGNYKLIYVNNDDQETSNPDYKKYLGDDFDTSLLEN
jgi:GWxTD domain-containing protein